MGSRINGTALDGMLAAVIAAGALAAAVAWPGVRPLDTGGALLLAAACLVLTWRRRWPGPIMVAMVALVLPYHLLQYQHHAAVPAEVLGLFTFAAMGRRVRVVLLGAVGVLAVCAIVFGMRANGRSGFETIGTLEGVAAVIVAVQTWRIYRARMAAANERAERAERTRDQEARRRVAEERLRIARDLHDLLAHSITVIGVQAGAAAHLVAGERPLDRTELAEALGSIAATCREARTELRGTLQVLRGTDVGQPPEELPGVAGIPDLLRAARMTGLTVSLTEEGDGPVDPEVGVAAYRIVQEALTNVVKHAEATAVQVRLERAEDALTVSVVDDGQGPVGHDPHDRQGFGILGMIERARSIGGTLDAGPGAGSGAGEVGFAVTAVLPSLSRTGTTRPL
ncbi:sensor histidine kinase [Actinomadura barringtoniae]|nr:sensor histidine kinase [Actinomadura barringtoniae]